MKGKVILYLLTVTAVAAELEVGRNYDFYQKNGQHVLGGQLEEESDTEYRVRLQYVPKPIILNKANLEKTPVLSKIQPVGTLIGNKPLQTDFIIHASGGYSYLTFGPLNSIFKTGYMFGAGADWLIFREPVYRIQSISVTGSFTFYQNSPRKIQLVSLQAGPKFLIWKFPAIDAAIFGSVLAGLSLASLTGYTFTSNYTTFSATGILHFEKRIRPVIIGIGLYANYLADSSLAFVSTGVSLSVLYPLGNVNAF
jgi:hypothetical protein